MQFLVMQMQPADVNPLTHTEFQVGRKSVVKSYHTTTDSASEAARRMAVDNPGMQYAVFAPTEIFETLPPVAPKIIRKQINEAGEIVVVA